MSDSGGEDFDEQLRLESEERAKRSAAADSVNAGQTRVDPDGTVYEWDLQKHAWFPKIDQDFIAQYLMSYGTNNSSSSSNSAAAVEASSAVAPPEPTDPSYAVWYYRSCYGVDPDVKDPAYKEWYNYYYGSGTLGAEHTSEGADGVARCEPPEGVGSTAAAAAAAAGHQAPQATDRTPVTAAGEVITESGEKSDEKGPKLPIKRKELSWFELEDEHNSNVYISGMPRDITQTEFEELMTKCGLIAFDYDRRKPKAKLYRDAEGVPKGDGLCSYIKKESVPLAMQIIDGYELRGHTISVEPARFQMKGDFNPTLRKKPKSNKLKRKLKEKQEKLLDWHPDELPGQRRKSDKVVILKNMFDSREFDKNPVAIQEIREDIRTECSKHGQVKKVTVFDRNPEGVILIVFKEAEEADACIAALNGRWFAGRKTSAETWDGKCKYEIEETEEERELRIKQWESYLEKGGGDPADMGTVKPLQPPEVGCVAATGDLDAVATAATAETPSPLPSVTAEPTADEPPPLLPRQKSKSHAAGGESTDEDLDADSDDD